MDPATPGAATFQVAFLGDTGKDNERTLGKVRDRLAQLDVDLVVHDGDYLVQGQPCSRERMSRVRDVFDSFAQPLVYTPGDNEWLDCDDPGEQLDQIRSTFFPPAESLGRRRVAVERQATPYVENARWTMRGVVFATFNVPGPDGGGSPDARGRNDANVAWLHAAFDAAESGGAAGIVLVMQDNPVAGGFPRHLLAAIRDRAAAFGRPVAVVNGDTHRYGVEQPWDELPNLVRAETWGPGDADRWVHLVVDPTASELFRFDAGRLRTGS